MCLSIYSFNGLILCLLPFHDFCYLVLQIEGNFFCSPCGRMGQVVGVVGFFQERLRHVQGDVVDVLFPLGFQLVDAEADPVADVGTHPVRHRLNADDGCFRVDAADGAEELRVVFDELSLGGNAVPAVQVGIGFHFKIWLLVDEVVGADADEHRIYRELLRIPQLVVLEAVGVVGPLVPVSGVNSVVGADFVPLVDEPLPGYAQHAVVSLQHPGQLGAVGHVVVLYVIVAGIGDAGSGGVFGTGGDGVTDELDAACFQKVRPDDISPPVQDKALKLGDALNALGHAHQQQLVHSWKEVFCQGSGADGRAELAEGAVVDADLPVICLVQKLCLDAGAGKIQLDVDGTLGTAVVVGIGFVPAAEVLDMQLAGSYVDSA